jgi:hypothetical protein
MATQTIVINNFGGRLTRILNGDLNSGFAKFDTSWGYDPFTQPMNLRWMEQPGDVAGIDEVVVGGINRARIINSNDGTSNTYVVGIRTANTGKLYKIAVGNIGATTNVTSVIGQQSVHGSYDWMGDLAFFGVNEQLYFAGSGAIGVAGSVIGNNNIQLNGFSSVISTSAELAGDFHPLEEFAGKLIFGNGPSIGAIDATGTIISSIFTISNQFGNQYSQLNPPLPSDQYVHDLDVSQDNTYLLVSASTVYNERVGALGLDLVNTAPGKGKIYGWNGVDQGVTTALTIPSGTATALQTYLQQNILFFNDVFGSSLGDETKKIVTLTNNKSPLSNSTDVNGNFVTWACPETLVDENGFRYDRVVSLYYFGSLDEQNPVGLYRLLRNESTLTNGLIYQVPYHAVVSNGYSSLNPTGTSVIAGNIGKHFLSTYSVSSVVQSASTVGAGDFLTFDVPGSGLRNPQFGVYETQTQLFGKKIEVRQIRVYTEPTVANNGFQIDLIGSDGLPMDNGTFNYSFVAGSDITKLQGSLTRINFNPTADASYALGVRISNTGTTNMVIQKIEIDWETQGR